MESYVIRGKSGIRFESCEIGKVGKEESYESFKQAENALAQIQSSFPFDEFEIMKSEEKNK